MTRKSEKKKGAKKARQEVREREREIERERERERVYKIPSEVSERRINVELSWPKVRYGRQWSRLLYI